MSEQNIYGEPSLTDEGVAPTFEESFEDYALYVKELESSCNLEDRIFYMFDDFADDVFHQFIVFCRYITGDKPITIVINSNGGDVINCMAMIDYIKGLPFKVNVLCRGKAFSAAAVLLTCTTGERYMSKNSMYMMHEVHLVSANEMNSSSTVKAQNKLVSTLTNSIFDAYVDKSKVDRNWIETNFQANSYLTAEECLKYGFIDKII